MLLMFERAIRGGITQAVRKYTSANNKYMGDKFNPNHLSSVPRRKPYTNEVNQHTPSGWCVYSKFAYGDVDNPLRTYRGKDYIETFCKYIKGEARRLYHMFP